MELVLVEEPQPIDTRLLVAAQFGIDWDGDLNNKKNKNLVW